MNRYALISTLLTAALVTLVISAPVCLYAQESILGKYSGSFVVEGTQLGHMTGGVSLVISSVENGMVKGMATMGGRACAGDYPVVGTYKGNELAVRSTVKGGRAGDCTFGLRGKVEGNKIVGKMGQYDVQMSK